MMFLATSIFLTYLACAVMLHAILTLSNTSDITIERV